MRDRKDHTGFLATARGRYNDAREYNKENQENAIKDLKFYAGDEDAHWDSETVSKLKQQGRSYLVVNQTQQFPRQVANAIRQRSPRIRCFNYDDVQAGNDIDPAQLRTDIIRYIENRSDAKHAYYTAVDQQCISGIGHWQVCTEPADDGSPNQEIAIRPIYDGASVLWDASSRDLRRRDANYCFVPYDMHKKDYEAAYPNSPIAEIFEGGWEGWTHGDIVRLAWYFERVKSTSEHVYKEDGTSEEYDKAKPEHEPLTKASKDSYKVYRSLITGGHVLKYREEIPCSTIPIVPVYGEVIHIGKRTVIQGVTRPQVTSQKTYNLARSVQVDLLVGQGRTPVILTPAQISGYEKLWANSNELSFAYLLYNPDPTAPAPFRLPPPSSSSGVNDYLAVAQQELQSTTGIYSAALGQRSNETSGVAINSRRQESDTGTYVYDSNFQRALVITGEIILEMMPRVYDTYRKIRTLSEDGSESTITINQNTSIDEQERVLNDITKGRFGVIVDTGGDYSTKKQENLEFLLDLVGKAPDLLPLTADKLIQFSDMPDSQDVIRRIRIKMDQSLLTLREREELIDRNAQPAAPTPPSPEMQIEMMKMRAEDDKRAADVRMKELELQQRQIELEIKKEEVALKMAELQASTPAMAVRAPEPVPQEYEHNMQQFYDPQPEPQVPPPIEEYPQELLEGYAQAQAASPEGSGGTASQAIEEVYNGN